MFHRHVSLIIPLVFGLCHGSLARPQEERFEVASIKLSPPTGGIGHVPPTMIMAGGPWGGSPTRLTIRNYPLRMLIMKAWEVRDYELSVPGFLKAIDYLYGDRFDIDAVLSPGTTEPQLLAMLRHLLAERFDMELHREQKEITIQMLVVAKGGPKLVSAPDPAPDDQQAGASKALGMHGEVLPDRIRYKFTRVSMKGLVAALASLLNCPVVDRTGLSGRYDFVLEHQKGAVLPNESGAVNPGAASADIPSALQADLGLKLVPEKSQVDVLVIDRCNRRPSEN